MNLNGYSYENLNDFSQYVFGIEYKTLKHMIDKEMKKIKLSKIDTYKRGG